MRYNGQAQLQLFTKILRTGLVTEPLPEQIADAVTLAREIDRRARALFGRALAIRDVDAGSCNGCEVEIANLPGPVYDMERFGLHFVASPRHADRRARRPAAGAAGAAGGRAGMDGRDDSRAAPRAPHAPRGGAAAVTFHDEIAGVLKGVRGVVAPAAWRMGAWRLRVSADDLATLSFPASRFEREMRDMLGITPAGARARGARGRTDHRGGALRSRQLALAGRPGRAGPVHRGIRDRRGVARPARAHGDGRRAWPAAPRQDRRSVVLQLARALAGARGQHRSDFPLCKSFNQSYSGNDL